MSGGLMHRDYRFIQEEGAAVYTGNELLFKGALEAEVALITGYPGSPISDLFDIAFAHRDLLKEHGLLAEMANNEALAVARLNGARMAGIRAMAVMKSVGLHVAADGLALGNLAEPRNSGGCLVVVGDDPWIDSTQINNDSRFLSQHLHMPILEPSTFQEMKDWVRFGFELSSSSDLYLTYLVTTHQADGGGTVWAHRNRYPTVNTYQPVTLDTGKFDLDKTVLLPPRTWEREVTLPDRLARLLSAVRQGSINRVIGPQDDQVRPYGFVASGLSYCYLEHALGEMGMAGKVPILKLGLTYPVDPRAVLDFALGVENIIVIEEKRGFVEAQINSILQQEFRNGVRQSLRAVWGKEFPLGLPGIPVVRGLNVSILEECLIPLFLKGAMALTAEQRGRLETEEAILQATAQADPASHALIARTPTFCPGCPHRDSSSLFLEIQRDFKDPSYMKREHHRDPVDLIFHGETGCFSMLMFEPNKPLMHNYSGMGLGGATGAGLDPFVTNKQVVFLGDSTFFHSGMTAISDSIKSGQDITYVILDNKTTAMTGHQPTPGTDLNLMGEKTATQSIERIVAAMASESAIPVHRVNPEDRESYRALLEENVLADGVKIIIADKECGLTYHRRRRRDLKVERQAKGFVAQETFINVTPEVCEFCLQCTLTTGCPGLSITQTLDGPKIMTDPSVCVADGDCARLQACPSFEQVIVHRQTPQRNLPALPSLEGLPAAPVSQFRTRWNLYMAGVGGMGTGLLSAILVRAGHAAGYRVLFLDKKGLAIRNGSVFAQVILSKEGGTLAPVIPYGKTDLLLGLDLLEASRCIDPQGTQRIAHPQRTSAIVNSALQPTVRVLMGQDQPSPEEWEKMLAKKIRTGRYWSADVSAVSERFFGTKLYANVILLGAASQRGELPLPSSTLESAIEASVPAEERAENLRAFQVGRLLVGSPDAFEWPEMKYSLATFIDEKASFLKEDLGSLVADDYRSLVQASAHRLGLEESGNLRLALRVYELIRYDGLALAQQYLHRVEKVAAIDRMDAGRRATRAVIENLFRVLAIKDEVYVSYLLTSREKQRRDQRRYGLDPSSGDRLEIVHLNKPEFVIWGKRFRWSMRTRLWQLRLMRSMKFLRRWLPEWHRGEKDFRDWYLSLVDQFSKATPNTYDLWLQLLQLPSEVRGYREVRVASMAAARAKGLRLSAVLIRTEASEIAAPSTSGGLQV